MEKKTTNYIESLGLYSRLQWMPDSDECDCEYCLVIIETGGGDLYLDVAQHTCFEDQGKYNNWMTSDDAGWSGPERRVVAWAGLNI